MSGLLLGGLGKIFFERYKFLQHRMIVACAFEGELSGIVETLHTGHIRKFLAASIENHCLCIFTPIAREERVYDVLKKDIGYLPKQLATRIPIAYYHAEALRRSLNEFCSVETVKRVETPSTYRDIQLDDVIDIYKQMIETADNVIAIYEQQLVPEIHKVKRQKFFWIFKV